MTDRNNGSRRNYSLLGNCLINTYHDNGYAPYSRGTLGSLSSVRSARRLYSEGLRDPSSRQQTRNFFNWFMHPVARVSINKYRNLRTHSILIDWNPQLSKNIREIRGKIGRGSQMGAWHQDGLADWLSVVIYLRVWTLASLRMKAGLNTSTIALWVEGGDEKGNAFPREGG
jgi:hypothetical protein